MTYVVHAVKNPCGSVEKGWLVDYYKSWVKIKPSVGIEDINMAFRVRAYISAPHINCGCKFEVEEV